MTTSKARSLKMHDYTKEDLKEVSANPRWTKADIAKAKPFAEAFPDLAKTIKGRGPQKAPKKVPVSIRLDELVIAYFKKEGPGWQSKINDLLVQVASRKGRMTVEGRDSTGAYQVRTIAKAPGSRTITKTKKRA